MMYPEVNFSTEPICGYAVRKPGLLHICGKPAGHLGGHSPEETIESIARDLLDHNEEPEYNGYRAGVLEFYQRMTGRELG